MDWRCLDCRAAALIKGKSSLYLHTAYLEAANLSTYDSSLRIKLSQHRAPDTAD